MKKRTKQEIQCNTVRRFFNSMPKEADVVEENRKVKKIINTFVARDLGLKSFESLLVTFLDEVLMISKTE